MESRSGWPLGAELRRKRIAAGLSVKAAAKRTRGKVSDGRWYQLESGVQRIRGQEIPIGTTPATVVAAAKAVEWDYREALGVAGFKSEDYQEPETRGPLQDVPIDDLLGEIRRRVNRSADSSEPSLRDRAPRHFDEDSTGGLGAAGRG